MSQAIQSVLVHGKIVLGKPAGMQQWTANPTLFFQKVLSDIGFYHGIALEPAMRSQQSTLWGEPEVVAGQQSAYLHTSETFGQVVRFFGEGIGDLHFYDGSAQRHIGAITEASWAYIPAGPLYYFYSCNTGALACEGLDVWRQQL